MAEDSDPVKVPHPGQKSPSILPTETEDAPAAARRLRALGYRVLPLPAGEKYPPPAGWTETEEEYPVTAGENIGIASKGEIAILISNDEKSTMLFKKLYGEPNVYSVRGGHWYFSGDGGENLANRKTKASGTFEVHSKNKYAVAPPSRHPSGTLYRWGRALPPMVELPPYPAGLRSLHAGKIIEHGLHHGYIVREAASLARMAAAGELPLKSVTDLKNVLYPGLRTQLDDIADHHKEIHDACTSAWRKFGPNAPAQPAPTAAPVAAPGPPEDGRALFSDVRAHLNLLYQFTERWHPDVLGLFVLQSAVAKALPRVFHVYISGAAGSGKSSLLRRLTDLCSGDLLGDASTASLARSTAYGKTLGVDEADKSRGDAEAREAREALVRDAYRADAPPYTRCGTDNEIEEFPVFGPRILATREDLDSATAQRGIPIGTSAAPGEEAYALLLEALWPTGTSDLAARVRAWGEAQIAALTPGSLRAVATSEAFKGEVRRITGPLGATREVELAVIMALVKRLAGLEDSISESLRVGLAAGRTVALGTDDQAVGDAIEALRNLLAQTSLGPHQEPSGRVRRKEWLDAVNRLRRSRGDPPITSRGFGAVLRDLGVRDSWRVGTGGVVSFELPVWAVAQAQAGGGPFHPPQAQSGVAYPTLSSTYSTTTTNGESWVSGASGAKKEVGGSGQTDGPNVTHSGLPGSSDAGTPPHPPNNPTCPTCPTFLPGRADPREEDLLGPGPSMADQAKRNLAREEARRADAEGEVGRGLSWALRLRNSFGLIEAVGVGKGLGMSEEQARAIVEGLRASGDLQGPPEGPYRWRGGHDQPSP